MNLAKKLHEDDPEAPAARSKSGIFLIVRRCPYCGRRHYHGAGRDGKAYGHRWAHCLRMVGEQRQGYVLVSATAGQVRLKERTHG